MAENNAVTKEELINLLNELWDKVNGRFEASDRKADEFWSEVISRFEASDHKREELRSEMIRRFRRADRQRLALRQEMENRFYEMDGKIMNRFDLAEEHADQAVAELGRKITTKLDREAGVIDTFRTEQMTMGAVQDEMRDDLDETKKSHGAEIKDLKRRVTTLEEEIFPALLTRIEVLKSPCVFSRLNRTLHY
jgi:hypothetical protein